MKNPLLLVILLVGIAAIAAASDPAATPSSPPTAVRAAAPSALPSLDAEIATLLEQERSRLAELDESFRSAASGAEAWEIQKQIRQVKIDTEIAIMEIQHQRLVAAGRADEARAVAETLDALRHPEEARKRAARPEERPVPSER